MRLRGILCLLAVVFGLIVIFITFFEFLLLSNLRYTILFVKLFNLLVVFDLTDFLIFFFFIIVMVL